MATKREEAARVFTAPELADLLGVTHQRIHKLLKDGRIIGAVKVGPRAWIIPADFDIVERPEGTGGPPLMLVERMLELREQGVLREPRSDLQNLVERIEHLQKENERLERQIGKLMAGDDIEPMDVSISWLESGDSNQSDTLT